MIKIVAMIKRKSDLTFEEFSSYYFERHASLCWSLVPPEVADRIVHYVQNHARDLGGGRSNPPFDCVTEIGFADAEGLEMWNRWYLGPDGAAEAAGLIDEVRARRLDPARAVDILLEHEGSGGQRSCSVASSSRPS